MSRFGWTIDGHPIGASEPHSGFARPFVHVLFDQPPDWRASIVGANYRAWFVEEAGDWRILQPPDIDNLMLVDLNGVGVDCRLSHLPAPPARFAHEVANSPWFPDAMAAVARHRRRAVLSPSMSAAEWASAPHPVRVEAMRALTRVSAAFALLRHASATVWPVSRTVWAPRTAALVAHDPLPSTYWVRSAPDRPGSKAHASHVSLISTGLSAFVGCEVAVHANGSDKEKRAVRVLSDVVDHLIRRGVDGRDPFRFARHGAADRGIHIEPIGFPGD